MGLQIDREEFDERDYLRFSERLKENLVELRELLSQPGFGEGPSTLGAELEFFIIDQAGQAFPINRTLLAESLDSRLQLELDRYNIEYNCSPLELAGTPFTKMETELLKAIHDLNHVASEQGGRVVPIGILPTLGPEDLHPSMISDLPRYRALSAGIRRLRKEPFEICIDGPEPLTVSCGDVVLEGANTSLQVHLRVSPEEFAPVYNAAQIATPIALAICANSPTFLGHRLWDETRVSLFKQAIDVRPSDQGQWRRPSNVSFGHGWLREGAYELFAEAVGLFPALIPVLDSQCGDVHDGPPKLSELRLHNGTVWRWNRAVYDPQMGGHLRIEMRALPAGPTARDMVANVAFLIGLSIGLREQIHDLLATFPFEYAHSNFYRAAQHGLDAILLWPSDAYPSPREVSARQLVEKLLPVSEKGLITLGVDRAEANKMLSVIRHRLKTGMTGARWQRAMLDRLETDWSRKKALLFMLEAYLENIQRGDPVAEWSTEL